VYRNTIANMMAEGEAQNGIFAPDTITFIEWGDAVGDVLPEARVEVELRATSEDERRIAIRGTGEALRARLAQMPFAQWAVPV